MSDENESKNGGILEMWGEGQPPEPSWVIGYDRGRAERAYDYVKLMKIHITEEDFYMRTAELSAKLSDITRKEYAWAYKARKFNAKGRFTYAEWLQKLEEYNYKCANCGRNSKQVFIEPDHIIPLSKGGPNTIDNIQPLCHSCNSKKSDTIGRPRKDKKDHPTLKPIPLSLNPKVVDKIESLCMRENATRAEYLRKLIDLGLKNMNTEIILADPHVRVWDDKQSKWVYYCDIQKEFVEVSPFKGADENSAIHTCQHCNKKIRKNGEMEEKDEPLKHIDGMPFGAGD